MALGIVCIEEPKRYYQLGFCVRLGLVFTSLAGWGTVLKNHTETKKKRTISDSLCDSGGIQTHNLLIRSQMLYSVRCYDFNTEDAMNQLLVRAHLDRNQTYK